MFPRPIIDPKILTIAPGFRAVSLFVDAHNEATKPLDPAVLTNACRVVQEGGPTWAEAHLSSWSDVYSGFGAKPNRTPCSAQALRKRVLKDGGLPAINPVVDLYNAVSLRFAVPVGGENIDAYVGPPLPHGCGWHRAVQHDRQRRTCDRVSCPRRGCLAR